MGFKEHTRLNDLEPFNRLEFTCLKCKGVYHKTVKQVLDEDPDENVHLYLDEIQGRAKCRRYRCDGQQMMSVLDMNRTQGFRGGLA